MIFLVQPSTALHVTFVLNILNLGNAHLAFNYETHIFKSKINTIEDLFKNKKY